MAAVKTFPQVITASKWRSAFQALYDRSKKRRGLIRASDGVAGPRITNGEAAQLVSAWVKVAGKPAFPLWYQYAARAYGWNPPQTDALDTSPKQAADAYVPEDIAVALWVEVHRIATALDNEQGENAKSPRLELDEAFMDPTWMGDVRQAIQADGGNAALPFPPQRKRKAKAVGAALVEKKSNVKPLLLILGVWWLLANKPRRRRRRGF